MKQSGLLPGLLVLVLVVVSVPGLAQSSPPKNLKKVGDHWTAWDPPPAGEGAYVIKKGDTLWDLAGQWLGDPYLWPQVWDQNRYILDSHWIYPGDPLQVPGRPTVVPSEGPPPVEETPEPTESADSGGYGRTSTGEEVGEPSSAPTKAPSPLLPLGNTDDIYCTGHIEPEHEPSGLALAGVGSEKFHVATGDVVYLSHGIDWGLQPGDEFAVVRSGATVKHPQTGHRLGTYVKRLGRLRVMLVQEKTATAVVEAACKDIRIGDEMVPWADIPVPMARSIPPFERWDVTPSGGATGYIVSTSDKFDVIGPGHVIHTDLGAASGLRPGDIVTLYRTRESLPRTNLAQAVVLTVEPTTSTIKVTRAVQEIFVGDHVEVANQ